MNPSKSKPKPFKLHKFPVDGEPPGHEYAECLVHRPACRKCVNCGEWIRPEQDGQPCKPKGGAIMRRENGIKIDNLERKHQSGVHRADVKQTSAFKLAITVTEPIS